MNGDWYRCGLQSGKRAEAIVARLTLHKATEFWSRLQGLYAVPPLSWDTGLYISPCWAIHTFGLSYPIDVVFLNGALQELKRVDAMRPNRMAFRWGAVSVVELPGGFCAMHADYVARIRIAMGTG